MSVYLIHRFAKGAILNVVKLSLIHIVVYAIELPWRMEKAWRLLHRTFWAIHRKPRLKKGDVHLEFSSVKWVLNEDHL